MTRLFSLCLGLCVALVLGVADAKAVVKDDTFDGKVVSVTADKLTWNADLDKKDYTTTLTADGKVLVDGKEAKLADLKPGMKIKITAATDGDRNKAKRIEGFTK
jgi:hypothetical protein